MDSAQSDTEQHGGGDGGLGFGLTVGSFSAFTGCIALANTRTKTCDHLRYQRQWRKRQSTIALSMRKILL